MTGKTLPPEAHAISVMAEALRTDLGYWNREAMRFANLPGDHPEVVTVKIHQERIGAVLAAAEII